MSENSDYENNDMLALFIDESREHLEVVEPALLTLEEKGDDADPETINTIFRAIHSIKGSAGFFGLKNITELSHIMENLMAKVREKDIATTPELINALLKGLDKLQGMVEDVSSSEEVDVSGEIAAIDAIMKGKAAPEAGAGTEEAKAEEGQSCDVEEKEEEAGPWKSDDYREHAAEAARKGHKLYYLTIDLPGGKAKRKKLIKEKMEFLSSIGIIIATEPEVRTEEDIKKVAGGKRGTIELLLSSILERDLLLESTGIPEEKVRILEAPGLPKAVQEDKKGVKPEGNVKPAETESGRGPSSDTGASARPREKTGKPAAKESQSKAPHSTETVRVRLDLLDKIMALAGEIVLGRNQLLRQYAGRKDNNILIDHSQRVTELQESVMKTRLQPVGAVFSKFRRIVRDMARKVDKKIDLHVEGEDVELDRSIIEVLSDPLTHMIRNSVDHAIEAPAERKKQGKPESGTISLRAFHEGGQVVIEIEDDGRGIDAERIKEKALQKGVISDDDAAKMNEKELVNLIFHPGFSTVTEVSELSGRGVGMDVVKRGFEKLGSTIDLQTTPGKGTLFTVRLPLTLAILPSVIVTVGPHTFAIPQIDITEIVRIREKDSAARLEDIEGQMVFRLRGKLLPVISLAAILEMGETGAAPAAADAGRDGQAGVRGEQRPKGQVPSSPATQRLIVMRYGANQLGLLVDTVLDPEEIVVKPMPRLVRSCKIFSSATIMGDGRVAMILNIGGIIEKAGFRFEGFEKEALQFEEEERKKALQERQSILIFKNAADEHFAISLSMISRIEKIKATEILSIAGKRFVQLRGHSIELVFVEDHIPGKKDCGLSGNVYIIIPKVRGQMVGICAQEIDDVIETALVLETGSIESEVVIGSAIINEEMTLVIDVFTLLDAALPGHSMTDARDAGEEDGDIRILLVEDTPFFRDLEERYFRSEGFKIRTANDGAAGLEVLRSDPGAFDIVVSDIEMPVMNGFELVEAIRNDKDLSHLPVMALTSLDNEEDRDRGLGAGFDAYEVKVDKEKLVTRVRELVRGRGMAEAMRGAVGA